MNRVVWKFPIPLVDWPIVEMPDLPTILSFAMQHGKPTLWALVDPDAPKSPRLFRFAGTGHDFGTHERLSGTAYAFVGTIQASGGALVFHLFDCGPVRA